MPDTKYLTWSGLSYYDGKNKTYIAGKADAAQTAAIAASEIGLDVKESANEGYAKTYELKQNDVLIGEIDIPADLVVASGRVVTDPQGQPAGTYVELTLNDPNADKIYINVATLVDAYTAAQNATQVQLAISGTNEISGTIVAGSIGTTELASEVVASLGKADTAVQSVAEGSVNGTVSVDGTDVNVHGLGGAAYEDTTAFDAAGTATTKVNELANGAVATNTSAIATLNGEVTDDGSVKKIAKGYADAAQTAAEGAVTALENGQVATNTSDIATLDSRVDALEAAEPEAITNAEIDTLFPSESTGE